MFPDYKPEPHSGFWDHGNPIRVGARIQKLEKNMQPLYYRILFKEFVNYPALGHKMKRCKIVLVRRKLIE